MTHPRFFGYGSLVNRRTHSYPDARPLILTGWHRQWICIPEFDVAVLSVRPDPDTRIAGLTADVPDADWSALDARESGYKRTRLTAQPSETWIYAVPPDRHAPGEHVILLSYLDVVVQGFLTEFGATGAEGFFATTDRWRPILDDRAAPRYPRHQTLTAQETAIVDDALTAMGATIITA